MDSERLETNFKYHAPKDDQPKRYELLRAMGKQFSLAIMENSHPSREQSLALTKIDEAVMWANAGIARNE